MCVYYTDPQLASYERLITVMTACLRTTTAPPKISVLPPAGSKRLPTAGLVELV